MVYLNLLFIQLILVFIIDLSGFSISIKRFISRVVSGGKIIKSDYDLKPFCCSLCMVFWVGLVYLLCTSQFELRYIIYVCFLSLMSTVSGSIMLMVRDILNKIISTIYKVFSL